MTMVQKSEIENLAASFRVEVMAVILKYQGGNALGAVGGFIADIEAHRARYANQCATFREGADPATIALANETERKIDALARQEIQRVRAAGRVELNSGAELALAEQPAQLVFEPVGERQLNAASVGVETMAEEAGPEKYAPLDRRAPEKRTDVEQIAVQGQRRNQVDAANAKPEDLDAVIQAAAGVSLDEIDRVIHALERVRETMRKEGERVSREVAGYASLSHATVTAMKVIADSIKSWNDTPDKPGHSGS